MLSRKDPEGPYIDGDGASLEYAYDENKVTVKTKNREIVYEYNPDGTLKSVTTGEGTTEYRYQDGVLAKTIFPNHTAEAITYDELGRIDVIKTVKIDPVTEAELEVLASYDYEVDDAGNREEVIDHNGRKVEYKYDELNRVIEEKITNPLDASENGRLITYTYDGVGNLDYKGDTLNGDTDFVYNHLNQLVSSTFAGVETLYTYDDNGSLKTRKTGDKTITYDWENDGENRLVGVEIVEGNERTEIEYEYNENGIRVGKTVDGVETSYLIDELQPYAQVLEEYDASGNLQAAYTYGEDLISRNGQFYHKDGLGSTRLLTDAFGGVSESYNYDAYGNLITGDGSENPYLFAGEQWDFETGLDYLRARYYDSTLGRFISRDAYQGLLNDPMSQHKYQYAHANPVVNTDPSGYATFTQIAAASAFLTTLAGLSYTTGGALGTLAGGGSVYDAISLYDQYFAGFSDIASFGISTKLRNKFFPDIASRNHRGAIFNMGRLGGAVASFVVGGFSGSSAAAATSSPLWAMRFSVAYTTFGNSVSAFNSFFNILRNGKITFTDLLGFLPTAAAGLNWAIGLKPNLAGSLGSSGAWRNLPGGVRIKQVGNYFIKEVNPNANLLERIYGISSLDEQAKGLALLADMAPSFLYKNGKIITRNIGNYTSGNIWTTRLKASLRLGTPFNDVVRRNIGANGRIFDPSKIPFQQAAEAFATGILSGTALAFIMNGASTIFRGDR